MISRGGESISRSVGRIKRPKFGLDVREASVAGVEPPSAHASTAVASAVLPRRPPTALRHVRREAEKAGLVVGTVCACMGPDRDLRGKPEDQETGKTYIKAIIDGGIKVVETAGHNPQEHVEDFKAHGIKVIHKCTAVRHALSAERMGVDAISIDGFECAGHPGEDDIPGLILIPAAANKVKIPMLASGGFGDGRGLVAALALGADGINMGTRFCATVEAPIHERVKQFLVENDERATNLIFRSLRNTGRVGKNTVSDEVVKILRNPDAKFENVSHLVKGADGRKALESGDINAGLIWAGQVQGLINDIPTVAVLMKRIINEAKDIIQERLNPVLQ